MTANPCLACDARCCRRYAIYVLPEEVARIAADRNLPRANVAAAETVDLTSELPVVYLEGQPAQLVLARDPGSGACVFLDEETSRCTIHDLAPYICQMYPYTATGDVGPRIRLLNDVLCPAPYPLAPACERELAALSLEFWNERVNVYRSAAQRWNLRLDGGGAEALLAFCLDGE
jgi:Fe-S-cluster containining protein